MARTGVVGCGRWGRNLIRNFSELGVLAAVSDVAPTAAKEFSATFSVPAMSPSQLLMSEEIDAVAIAVPAESHAELALQAIKRGKHVFVEKPVATRIFEAEQLNAAASEFDVTFMVGHLLRYHPAFIELARICSDGGIGEIEYIQSSRSSNRMRFRGEKAIWGFAPHDISMFLALLGELPNSVFARRSACEGESGPDAVVAAFEFPSGASGHLFVSWIHRCREQRLIVSGETGTIIFDDCQPWQSKLMYSRDEGRKAGDFKSDSLKPIAMTEAEPLKLECEHFLECIDLGRRPTTDGQEALAVLRVLDAMNESIDSGRNVTSGEARHVDPSPIPQIEGYRAAATGAAGSRGVSSP